MTPCATAESSVGITHGVALDDKEAKQRACAAKWRANNKDKIRAANAARYADPKHRAIIRARTAQWHANPENRAKQKARDAIRRATPEYKAIQKARHATWYARPEVKARQRAKSAEWRTNPENKAKQKIKEAERRAHTRAKRNASSAKYYANNREKANAANAKCRATPQGRANARAAGRARRAQKLAASIGDQKIITTWEKRWRTTESVKCYWCRTPVVGEAAHMDHIQPLIKGGAHAIENLCISCQPCNNRKSAKALATWNKELLEPVLF